MKQLKQISEITQPMNTWQVADLLFGLPAPLHLVDEAFKQMKRAGWTFLEYDENGDEVWQPPGSDEAILAKREN